jgi:hypothetical protein
MEQMTGSMGSTTPRISAGRFSCPVWSVVRIFGSWTRHYPPAQRSGVLSLWNGHVVMVAWCARSLEREWVVERRRLCRASGVVVLRSVGRVVKGSRGQASLAGFCSGDDGRVLLMTFLSCRSCLF